MGMDLVLKQISLPGMTHFAMFVRPQSTKKRYTVLNVNLTYVRFVIKKSKRRKNDKDSLLNFLIYLFLNLAPKKIIKLSKYF